jgi:hypothetical protein
MLARYLPLLVVLDQPHHLLFQSINQTMLSKMNSMFCFGFSLLPFVGMVASPPSSHACVLHMLSSYYYHDRVIVGGWQWSKQPITLPLPHQLQQLTMAAKRTSFLFPLIIIAMILAVYCVFMFDNLLPQLVHLRGESSSSTLYVDEYHLHVASWPEFLSVCIIFHILIALFLTSYVRAMFTPAGSIPNTPVGPSIICCYRCLLSGLFWDYDVSIGVKVNSKCRTTLIVDCASSFETLIMDH